MSPTAQSPRRRRRLVLFLLAAASWTLLAMYPDPAVFFRNLARYRRLPLDPTIEQKMGWDLPPEPSTIEHFVDSLILSTPDWAIWRVPWYVPTALESARLVHGDCESKTILLGSLLEGKGLPYEIRASFTHIWIDYPGRRERVGESRDIAYLEGEPGKLRLHWPDRVSWREFFTLQKEQLWDAMPMARKAIWLLGLTWVALGAAVLGGPGPSAALVSRWRVRAFAYLSRAAWLAFFIFLAIALAPNLRANVRPVRWGLVDLQEVLALSLLAGAFVAWLGVIRPRRAVGFQADGSRLERRWTFGLWQGSASLGRENVEHFALAGPSGGPAPWAISAALGSGRRIALLRYGREADARAALRRLGLELKRPIVVQVFGNEYWTAADEIGTSLQHRAARRPKFTLSARPSDLYLSVEEADGGWAIGHGGREAGAVKTLLWIAAMVAGAAAAGTILLALFPGNLGAWLLWGTAAVLLGMTIYAALSLREEILAWLGGSHVEVRKGKLSYYRGEGRVESVPLEAIESIELGRKGGVPTIAVVVPQRIIHLHLYCAPKHRAWVREAIAGAIVAGASPQ